MRLTVVGCSGSLPSPRSAASCYLVEAGGTRVLLDLGSGALGPLPAYVDPLALDAVLLSHLHADHCLDLCGLHVLRAYGPRRPERPLPVHGPTGTAGRLARAYDVPEEPGLDGSFTCVDHVPGPVEIGGLRVTTARVEHPVEAYAVRLEHAGRSLVYSGDTGPSDALVELARGADLLLCEASWTSDPAGPPGLHLSGAQAGEHAARAGVGRLVTTHAPPWTDPERVRVEAAQAYAGPVDAARPGLVVEV